MNTTLLAQADLLLLLADVFRPRRAGEAVPQMPEAVEMANVAQAAGLAPDTKALAELVMLTTAMSPDDWSNEYHRLFEGATVCPLNEAAYVRRDKGALLGDIAAFYQAFGIVVREDSGERHDHLVSELEFVAALLVMASQAAGRGDANAEAVVRDALRDFAASHPGEFILPLCEHGRLTAWTPAFRAAFDALQAVWSDLAAAHQWPAPAPAGDVVPQVQFEPPDDECAIVPEPAVQLSIGGRKV